MLSNSPSKSERRHLLVDEKQNYLTLSTSTNVVHLLWVEG